MPSGIFKEYIDLFLTYLTGMINLCLAKGIIPQYPKHAVVTPILKKTNLNKHELKNYRSVSNLSFLSKVIERTVSLEFKTHLETNILMQGPEP